MKRKVGHGNSLQQLGERLLDWQLLKFLTLRCQDYFDVDAFYDQEYHSDPELRILPSTYENLEQYQIRWEELLVIEIREQLLKGFLEGVLQCEQVLSWSSVQVNQLQLHAQVQFTLPYNLNIQYEQGLIENIVEKEMIFQNHANKESAESHDVLLQPPNLYDLVVISPNPLQLSAITKSFASIENQVVALEDFLHQGFLLGLVVHIHNQQHIRRHNVLFSMNQWKHIAHIPTSTSSSSSSKSVVKSMEFVEYRMYYLVVGNVRSHWREYHALLELNELQTPLLPAILSASPASVTAPANEVIDLNSISNRGISHYEQDLRKLRGISSIYCKHLRTSCNLSQIQAITIATKEKEHPGFTLIQGPPGTGKTTTIMHILNTLHIHQYHDFYEPLLQQCLSKDAAVNQRTADMQIEDLVKPWLDLISEHTQRKPRYLIVAPSNIAIDHLALRIMEEQFRDSLGHKYSPKMIRISSSQGKCHTDLKAIELTELLQDSLFPNFTFADKQAFVIELQVHMHQLVERLIHIQALLVNLVLAFHQYFPLPGPAWELRVDPHTDVPYWVNHELQTTSPHPPLEEIQAWWKQQEAKDQKYFQNPTLASKLFQYPTAQSLPEYRIHSQQLIQTLQMLHELHMKEIRMSEIISISDKHDFLHLHEVPKASRDLLETTLLNEAELVFATLNACGQSSMESYDFEYVIVDEAAQCTEPSVLIALQKSCQHCLLVGDSQQLAPTTFSLPAKQQGYDISLFERLMKTIRRNLTAYTDSYVMLNEQYRMLPAIAHFPSLTFYGGRLLNSTRVQKTSYLPFFLHSGGNIQQVDNINRKKILFPFLFVDVQYSSEKRTSSAMWQNSDVVEDAPSGSSSINFDGVAEIAKDIMAISKSNLEEVDTIRQLLLIIREQICLHHTTTSVTLATVSVGIITPYRDQCKEIHSMLRKSFSNENQHLLDVLQWEVNTVDGFQGKEKDIIIMSTVRSNQEGRIGFLSDARRFNVAVTRAKFALYIIGHATTLTHDRYWKLLLQHAENSQALIRVPNNQLCLKDLLRQHCDNFTPSNVAENRKRKINDEYEVIEV